jgi:hypothetical protein
MRKLSSMSATMAANCPLSVPVHEEIDLPEQCDGAVGFGCWNSCDLGISTGRMACLHRVSHERERRVNSAYGKIQKRVKTEK